MKDGGRGRDKGAVFPVKPEVKLGADGKKLGYTFPPKSDLTAPKKKYPSYALFPGITKRKQRLFLSYFAKCHNRDEAAKLVPMDIRQHYYWMKVDKDYPAHFENAELIAADIAEDAVFGRGIMGYQKDLSYKGVKTDTYTDYSDALAMFWLRGARPEKYRDSLVGLTSNAPVAIQINFGIEPKQNTESDLSKLVDNQDEPNKQGV